MSEKWDPELLIEQRLRDLSSALSPWCPNSAVIVLLDSAIHTIQELSSQLDLVDENGRDVMLGIADEDRVLDPEYVLGYVESMQNELDDSINLRCQYREALVKLRAYVKEKPCICGELKYLKCSRCRVLEETDV